MLRDAAADPQPAIQTARMRVRFAPSLLARLVTLSGPRRSHDPVAEHINLTGDYTWHAKKCVTKRGFRPLPIAKTAILSP